MEEVFLSTKVGAMMRRIEIQKHLLPRLCGREFELNNATSHNTTETSSTTSTS